MYGSMAGLGMLETSSTGVRSVSRPSCITQAELDEANAKCQRTMIRGIGDIVNAPMSGRLSAFSPCDLHNLPVCPTPTCIDQYTAGLISNCIAGGASTPDFDCTSLYTYALSRLPFCGGVLPPLPACLTPDVVQVIAYCRQYPNADGPNKSLNASCWLITHDASYWARLQAIRVCGTGAPLEPPTHVVRPPADGGMPPVPPSDGQGNSEASMTGMWGILALVAAAGGGYYLYRRYKK